jgi:hypothetical protein
VIKAALGHTHSYSNKLTSNREGHWYACSGCSEKKNYAAHTYTNSCDTDCNTCGYTRSVSHNFATTWTTDSNGHWHACAGCSEKGSYVAHTWNGNSCSVCGANNPNATQPTDPTEPSTDPSTPPTEPSTTPTEPSEPSTQPSEPSTPTTPDTEPSSGATEPSVAPSDPQNPVDNNEGGNSTWIVPLIVGVVCVAGGIAVGVIISKKKR